MLQIVCRRHTRRFQVLHIVCRRDTRWFEVLQIVCRRHTRRFEVLQIVCRLGAARDRYSGKLFAFPLASSFENAGLF